MSQGNLNVLESDSFIQEIMGERMPEIVGIHPLLNPRFLRKTLQQVPDVNGLDRLGEILFRDAAENRRVPSAIDAEFLPFHHPEVKIHLGLRVQPNHAHFIAFPDYPQSRVFRVVVAGADSKSFADPKAAPVKDDNQNLVAEA